MSIVRKNLKMPLLILLLVFFDQYIKIYISKNLMNENFYIFKDIVEFFPAINKSYSWFNSMFDLGIGLLPHIIITIIILVIFIVVFDFIRQRAKVDQIINLLFTFLFAGLICSLVDRVFWGGSLDYIYFKGFFAFDLKDVYLSIFIIIFTGCWLFNYKGFRKIDEKLLYDDFKSYLKSRFLKK